MRRKTLWINLSLGVAVVLAIFLLIAVLRPQDPVTPARTVIVTAGDVVSTVTASGTVDRSGAVDLVFGASGTVREVRVVAGDEVQAGEVLVQLDNTAALQQMSSAESSLAQALSGAANADVSLATAQRNLANATRAADASNARNKEAVRQARENLSAAQNSWSDACLDVNSTTCPNPAAQAQIRSAENAVTAAQLAFDNAVATAANAAIGYNVSVNQATVDAERARADASTTCSTYGDSSTQCSSAVTARINAEQLLETAILNRTSNSLRDSQTMATASASLSNAQVALQKAQADLRKANADAVRSARQALTNAEQARDLGEVTNAQSVAAAQASVDSALAGQTTVQLSDGDEVSPSQAAVLAAERAVEVAEQALAETALVAPIDGEVGAMNVAVGDVVSAATGVAAVVLPADAWEVQADFAESDAARITVGDPVRATIDALPGIVVDGTVASVEPLATTSPNGLVTYGVRVSLEKAPDGIRDGMTASVSVEVDKVSAALAVPQSVITVRGDEAFVLKVNEDGTTTEISVQVGVQGDGLTEITGGIGAGDTLAVPTAEKGAAANFPEPGVPGGGRPSGGR